MSDERAECSEALLRIYEYLDGEMSAADCAKIRAHLDECGPCFAQYDVDTTMKAMIKRACGCEPAPESLRETIMTRISMTVIRMEGRL